MRRGLFITVGNNEWFFYVVKDYFFRVHLFAPPKGQASTTADTPPEMIAMSATMAHMISMIIFSLITVCLSLAPLHR